MIIKELKIYNFGKFKNKCISFSDKLNIIYGSNESGKTTIMSFIRFMLFGGQGRNNDVKNYFPMDLSAPSGDMVVTHNKADYLITRNGVKKKGSYATVTCLTSGEVTTGDKAELVIEDMIGMSEDMFMSTVFVKDISDSTFLAKEEILQRLENLSSSGDENVSFDKIITSLEEEKLNLTSPRRKDAVIPKAEKELISLESSKKELLQKIADEEQIKNDISNIEKREKELSLQTSQGKNEDNVKILVDEYTKTNEEIIRREAAFNNYFRTVTRDDAENLTALEKAKKSVLGYVFALFAVVFGITCAICDSMTYLPSFICPMLCILSVVAALLSIWKFVSKVSANRKLSLIYAKSQSSNYQQFMKNYENFILATAQVTHLRQKLDKLNRDIKTAGEKETTDKKIYQRKMDEMFSLNSCKIRLQTELETLGDYKNSIGEIDSQILKIKEKLEKYSECVKIIDDTIEMLQLSYKKYKKDFSPELSRRAGEIFSKVSGNENDTVIVTDNLSLALRRGDSVYPVANLSRSTIDLLYFAFRISSVIMMAGEGNTLFLDEAFIRYDSIRLTSVLKYISAANMQIVMTTFSDYEKSIAEKESEFNLIVL